MEEKILEKFRDTITSLINLVRLKDERKTDLSENKMLIDQLVNKILDGIEDKNIPMEYKGDISRILDKYYNMYHDLCDKNKERKEKLEEFNPEKAFNLEELPKLFWLSVQDCNYNLVNILKDINRHDWIKEIILSDMDIEKRIDAFKDGKYYCKSTIINELGDSSDLIRGKTKYNYESKMKELGSWLKSNSLKTKDIIKNLYANDLYTAYYLQKTGLFDLNKYYRVKDIYDENIFEVSASHYRLKTALEMMNSEFYRDNLSWCMDEDVLFLLEESRYDDYATIINESGIEVDCYLANTISNIIKRGWNHVYSIPTSRPYLFDYIANDYNDFKSICKAVLNGAKNRDDYNGRERFSKQLLESIDKDKAYKYYNSKTLEEKREELLNVLNNINNSVQEEPGNKKIKEIDFKNLS